MKITDLMHGDWFNSKKGTCRINEIKLFTAIVEYSDEAYQDNGNVSSEEIDFEYDIEPQTRWRRKRQRQISVGKPRLTTGKSGTVPFITSQDN